MSVVIIQLKVSAALMQVTVSAANMWVTMFIVIMPVEASVAIMQGMTPLKNYVNKNIPQQICYSP